MCGVVGLVGGADERQDAADVRRAVASLRHRGPDAAGGWTDGRVVLGHARLAIRDLDPRSDQPFLRGRVALSYNGELWNADELREELSALEVREVKGAKDVNSLARGGPGPPFEALEVKGANPPRIDEAEADWPVGPQGLQGPQAAGFETTGDTEVVAAALDRWGLDALRRMDGMWAMAWTEGDGVLRVATDRMGEVPLHACVDRQARTWVASEVRALPNPRGAVQLGPGRVWTFGRGPQARGTWYDPAADPAPLDLARAASRVRELIGQGVTARRVSDVPVCTLLSGGIDSSAVAWHLRAEVPGLVGYSAVMDPRSRDRRCARAVAEALGVELVEVEVPPPSPEDLAEVVRAIEMPHKAQVEIGWACVVLAEAMRSDGFRVTFSGEGSDELWGSYGFAHHGIVRQGWHAYRKALFLEQHRKNFARCNKVFLARGIECRLPFCHRPLVELALSLPREAVEGPRRVAKAVMREAYRGLLPDEVVGRPKVAFQDGLGLKRACAQVVADPRAFYLAEHRRAVA